MEHPEKSARGQAFENVLRSPRSIARLTWIALGIGVTLRVGAYLQRPSLWIDEAMLALNIATRSYSELLAPLDMLQVAPPLFLWIERTATLLGGVNELALRAWPLATGIATLMLLCELTKRVVSPTAALSAVFLYSTSLVLIRYSNEAKPYGSDAFATLMVVLPAWIICEGRGSKRTWAWLAIASLVTPLFSFTTAFVLLAIFATFLFVEVSPVERRHALVWTGLGCVVALASIARTRDATIGGYMDLYWQNRFIPRDLQGLRALIADAIDIVQHGRFLPLDPLALRGIFSDTMELAVSATIADHTYLYPRILVRAYVVGSALLMVVGASRLIWIYRARASLLIGPLAVGIGANLAGRYPIALRLWMFAAPLLLVLLVSGISSSAAWISVARRQILILTATLAIGLPVAITATGRLWRPASLEHTRPIVAAVQAVRSREDVVYVYPRATPAWLVYATAWRDSDTSSLRAYMRAASLPDGPAFINMSHPTELTGDFAPALLRSTPLGFEIFGTSSGVHIRYRDTSDRDVSVGWGQQQVNRVLDRSPRCVWTIQSHVPDAERVALESALAASGFAFDRDMGDGGARAARFCRAGWRAPAQVSP